jgi:hypothetical protein
MSEETITITKAEYNRLIRADLFLECLNAGGVDNWEWYECAQDDYNATLKAKGMEPDDE